MQNLDIKIKSIEDLKKFTDKTNNNPYKWVLELQKQGYELMIAEAFPEPDGSVNKHCVGLYCKNYLEIIERSKENPLTI